MKKRPTLADISRIANVSLMTASRAINDKPGVSEDLRLKIREIAAEIGYRPNIIARGLATRQTFSIGLVVPDISNPFFAGIARGVEDAAYENKYTLYLVNTNEDQKREEAALDSLWQNEVDGLILCSSRLPEAALIQQVQRFPATVLVNRELRTLQPGLVTINLNDQEGAQAAVRYFVEQGRKQIGYIGGPANSLSNRRRLQGYRQALKAAGRRYDPAWVEENLPTTQGGWTAALTMLVRKPNVDALLVFNDLMAVGALQAFREVGKRIPEDIAIIGVDDIPLATIIRPRLSTLHADLHALGRTAMQSLLGIIAGQAIQPALQAELNLILRDSA